MRRNHYAANASWNNDPRAQPALNYSPIPNPAYKNDPNSSFSHPGKPAMYKNALLIPLHKNVSSQLQLMWLVKSKFQKMIQIFKMKEKNQRYLIKMWHWAQPKIV